MTIEQVLAAEVPEGIYKKAMQTIQDSLRQLVPLSRGLKGDWELQMDKHIDSLRAAFEALMDLSNGALEHENLTGFVIGKKAGRTEMAEELMEGEVLAKEGKINLNCGIAIGRAEAIKEVLAVVENTPIDFSSDNAAYIFKVAAIKNIRALEVPSEQA